MFIDTDKYIDAGEAARIIGIKRSRMSQLCSSNRFPGQVKLGHFWLIPIEAIKNFERNKPGPKAKQQELKANTQEDIYPASLDFDDDDDDGNNDDFDITDQKEIAIREKLRSLVKHLQ